MSRYEIIVKEHGKPVCIAKSEHIETCREKFDKRFMEKYGGKKNVTNEKIKSW